MSATDLVVTAPETVEPDESTATGEPVESDEPVEPGETGGAGRRIPGWLRRDGLVYLIYLFGGVFVSGRLWVDLHHRVLSANSTDQSQFDWFLAQGAWVVTHGDNPLFTRQMNFPNGVNLMANTSCFGLTIPLAPITLLFGPDASFATLLVIGLAGTAAAWYWVLSRTLVPNRLAAFVAGALCGFAPGLVSHANGQPNLVAQFVLPLIAYRACKLAEPGRLRWLRNGLLLAPFVIWQFFINEEILLFTGLASIVFVGVGALCRPGYARQVAGRVVLGLSVAGVVTLLLLAYPLWYQFAGPQHYQGLPFDPSFFSIDPANFFQYSRESVAGSGGVAPRFVISSAEENAFFGVPLMLLVGVLVVRLWRESVAVRAAAVTAIVFGGLSLGAHVTIRGRHTSLPGPFVLLKHLPVVDLITSTRFALVMAPMLAMVLGIGLDRVARSGPPDPAPRRVWRTVWAVACVAALLPLAPTPLTASNRPAVPAFFTAGVWKQYVPAGRTVVTVPPPRNIDHDPLWWSAVAGLEPAMPLGYFLGPTSPTDPQAIFGAPARPTSDLLFVVNETGVAPVVTAQQRADARADLAYWRAGAVILQPGWSADALRTTVSALLGTEPVFAGGVWIWEVTP